MKITRKTEIETTDVRVGDQIQVGKYTATCQTIPAQGVALFCLDQYLDQGMAYNRNGKNAGGYAASDVRRDLNAPEILEIFAALPLVPHENGDLLRLATYGEMFGHDEWYKSGTVEPDNDEQWPLMADRRNRVADREGEPYEWGWLQNICVRSAAGACVVSYNGFAHAWSASSVRGRPPGFHREIILNPAALCRWTRKGGPPNGPHTKRRRRPAGGIDLPGKAMGHPGGNSRMVEDGNRPAHC